MLKTTLLKVKAEYLIQIVRFIYVLRRSCSTIFWLQRRKGVSRWWMARLAVIGIGTINIIEIDGMVPALEAVYYVIEARYNLISIRVLDEVGCRIQVQQDIITVSQGDRGNCGRREVWRIIQVERRKLSSRWSFKNKLGKELIARWSFKEDYNGT